MVLTPDNIETLSTEELNEIVWEMHKDIMGVRPRHMTTREDYLEWLKYELQPEVLVQRQAERADEEARWAQFDAEMEAGRRFDDQEQLELDVQGYPGEAYEHYDLPL